MWFLGSAALAKNTQRHIVLPGLPCRYTRPATQHCRRPGPSSSPGRRDDTVGPLASSKQDPCSSLPAPLPAPKSRAGVSPILPRGLSVVQNSRARDPDGRRDACPTLRKLFGHSATAQGRRAAAREESGWRTADGKGRRRGDSWARTINLARNVRVFDDRLPGVSSCARPPRGEGRRKNEECRKGAKPHQSHPKACW